MKSLAPFLAALALLGGCTVITYTSPEGASVSVSSLGTSRAIEGLEVTVSEDAKTLKLDGYTSEAEQVAEGVARGIASGLSPAP
ncbi:MAG: hypothetical protein AAGI68_17125 [Planctomycetota bacterium]